MTFSLEEAVPVLRGTPRVLDAWLRDLPAAWIRATEGPGTWSPYDVVGHLIHGERTDWIPRLELVMRPGGNPAFEPFDRFAQPGPASERPLGELLDEFAALRARNLEVLASHRLDAADLQRTGRHPEFGTVTLAQLLSTWVAHDLGHVVQIARVMARRYTTDVGPWTAYLSVFTR